MTSPISGLAVWQVAWQLTHLTQCRVACRADEVRIIDEEKNMQGVKPLYDAIQIAQSKKQDIILLNAESSPPLVRMMDFRKYRCALRIADAIVACVPACVPRMGDAARCVTRDRVCTGWCTRAAAHRQCRLGSCVARCCSGRATARFAAVRC